MPKFNIKAQAIPTVASAYADVIGTTDNQIVEIRNELIVEDSNQRFQIHDETIEQLAECIAKDGQLSPCIVAPISNGKYELIDGRHRRRAVIKAGLPTTKCIIKTNLTDKQKQTIRLTSNLIRNNDYLPSELAFAYKELSELENMKTISEETNLSKKKIYRYIRLTYLIEPFLNRVDNGTIPVIAAVELSYLTGQQQKSLFQFLLNHSDCKINTVNARQIKENPDDLEAVFYGKTTDSELYKELTNKALEPYRQNQEPEKVDKLSTSVTLDPFREPNVGENGNRLSRVETQGMDNLSTYQNQQEPESTLEPSDNTAKLDNLSTHEEPHTSNDACSTINRSIVSNNQSELLYQDADGNVLPIADIELITLRIICEAVIEKTHVDYYIFRRAYDSRDILIRWNDEYIKVSDSSCGKVKGKVVVMEWNAAKHMFRIVVNGKDYIMLHKTLEQVLRRYIREQYTLDRIQSVIKEKH